MTLRDFVLVELARAWQEEQGAARVDPEAARLTRDAPDYDAASAPEDKLLLYANTLVGLHLDAGEGGSAAAAIRGSLSLLGVIVPVVGGLAGAAMLGAALPSPELRPVSVFQFLAEGVLLPTAFLAWTLVVTRLLAGSVGRLHWAAWLLALLQGKVARSRVGALAGRVLRRSGVTAPLFASFSHVFWIASLAAFLGLGLWRFAFVDYLFSWSSTLSFTGEQVHRLFGWLAAPVAWIPGIEAPTMQQVTLSEFGSLGLSGETGGGFVHSTADPLADQAQRKGWVGVLVAIVLVWGLAPRFVALAVCRWSVRRGIRRCLDDATSRMILAALDPVAPAVGAEPRRDEPPPPALPRATGSVQDRAGRGLDVLVFATDPPSEATLKSLKLSRLGLSGTVALIAADDDDDAMDSAIDHLGSSRGPEGAIVTFGVEAIPDALKAEFLARVVAALGADAPVHVLLTGGAPFAASPRGARLPDRVAAWTTMAAGAGVPALRVHDDRELP